MRPSPSKSTSASPKPRTWRVAAAQPEPARRVAIDAARLTLGPKRDRRAVEEVGRRPGRSRPSPSRSPQADPHPGDDLPLAVAGHARRLADLLESQVALVGEQPAGRAVVGDVDVGSVVAGQLGDQDAQAAAFAAGRSRPISETSVNVPSPLLRYSRSGCAGKSSGPQ